jgi:hypothetical protein
MPPAFLIARIVGPVFVAIGVGVLINHSFYAGMVADAVRSPALVYLSGIAALVAGLAILNAHRTWSSDWRVVITVLGWLMAIGGVIRIVLPRVTASIATTIYSGSAAILIVGAIVLVVGGFLSFQGYRR